MFSPQNDFNEVLYPITDADTFPFVPKVQKDKPLHFNPLPASLFLSLDSPSPPGKNS
jgi:hypothetical protein